MDVEFCKGNLTEFPKQSPFSKVQVIHTEATSIEISIQDIYIFHEPAKKSLSLKAWLGDFLPFWLWPLWWGWSNPRRQSKVFGCPIQRSQHSYRIDSQNFMFQHSNPWNILQKAITKNFRAGSKWKSAPHNPNLSRRIWRNHPYLRGLTLVELSSNLSAQNYWSSKWMIGRPR